MGKFLPANPLAPANHLPKIDTKKRVLTSSVDRHFQREYDCVSFSYSILCGNKAKILTFFRSFAGLTTSQFFPQERIQGMISSKEFRVKESSRLPSANS